jgi:hypothetical protein
VFGTAFALLHSGGLGHGSVHQAIAPPEPEVKTTSPIATLVPEARQTKTVPKAENAAVYHVPIDPDFLKSSLIENNRIKSNSRALDLLIAVTFHTVLISIPILAGLYFTESLN